MGREINLDSIRALEKEIQEHERAIIKLKRARNSLLNVSTLLPPEILGSIFRWSVIPDGDFGGLSKGSYNFLLVCHHWFQVASGTLELWGFWGNSIQDWAHRHARCRTAPLDLVLGRYKRWYMSWDLDDTIRDALQDRATRDTIRQVHLEGTAELLNSVISSIITKGEETRSNSVESFVVLGGGGSDVDISNFFSRYHFPKLRRLDLDGFSISSWDLLGSRITSLTTLRLSLSAIRRPLLPTLSQMLSILSANPNLQSLTLSRNLVPDIDDDRSSSQVQLRHLKRLHLTSNLRGVFGLLNRLGLPDKMDNLHLSLSECSSPDLLQTLGPYLGNCVRRRFPDELRFSVHRDFSYFSIQVGDACKGDLTREDWFVAVDGLMSATRLEEEEADKLCFGIISHIPQEEVIDLTTTLPILRSEELCVRMRNLTHLCLEEVNLSTWFAEPKTREPYTSKDLPRRLRSITITDPSLIDGDWGPLTNFLTRCAAVGSRIPFLGLRCHPQMGEDVVESIRCAVGVFEDRENHDGTGDGDDDNH